MLSPAIEEHTSRVGLDPIDRVFLMENHDQAYHVWRDAGVKDRVLVHIDAHHDMWWSTGVNSLTIANFICLALKENMVRAAYWVVPDRTWETRKGRRAVVRHVKEITREYPGSVGVTKVRSRGISTALLGKPLTVCSLSSLPRIEEGVLLDIDVDFMAIRSVSYGRNDRHEPLPWCWPDDVLNGLDARNVCSDLVTIAYSVEGGYTPLRWKYLGDELALRLRRPGALGPIEGMALMRKAALAAGHGDQVTAEEHYRRASALLPDLAAPIHHLAHLCAETGRMSEGHTLYEQALAVDCSYRTAYNNPGFEYYWDKRFREAESEYRRILALDPKDACAHFGLGQLAGRSKRWSEAEAWFRKSLALNGHLIDAHRALGDTLASEGRNDEAIQSFEYSLKLAMHGHTPLHSGIATQVERGRILDTHHFNIHARLARLYQRQGAILRAINGYRMCIRGGYRDTILPIRLAYLYLKQEKWQDAATALWTACKMFWGRFLPRRFSSRQVSKA